MSIRVNERFTVKVGSDTAGHRRSREPDCLIGYAMARQFYAMPIVPESHASRRLFTRGRAALTEVRDRSDTGTNGIRGRGNTADVRAFN